MLKSTLVLALVLGATEVRANPDFTFIVPVQLENLAPTISAGIVDCVLQIRKDDFSPTTSAHSSERIVISNRRFSGDVRITITSFPRNASSRPEDARFYTCTIALLMPNPNGSNTISLSADNYRLQTQQALVVQTFKVEGDLKAVQKLPAGTAPVPPTPPKTTPPKK